MGRKETQPSVPKNWPQDIPYLTTPTYSSRLTPTHLTALRTRPAPPSSEDVTDLAPDLRRGPSPLVKIVTITDPSHPAHGQRGLFAARDLRPGTLVLPYLGQVHPGAAQEGVEGADAHTKSDYDLWLSRPADLAVDAARAGNEARFINDYRGVPGRAGPNAEFREVWDARVTAGGKMGERGIAVFVLPAGKSGRRTAGIARGEEILVSYGKGFWGSRRQGLEEEEVEEVAR